MSISETFLKSIEDGIQEIGGASAKALAEHTGWAMPDLKEGLDELMNQGRVEKRGKVRWTKYVMAGTPEDDPASPTNSANRRSSKKAENVIDAERSFATVEELLKEGVTHLPDGANYDNLELAKAICEMYPNCGFTTYDIVMKIAWAVKNGILKAMVVHDDGRRFRFYKA